jgi:hypothetical protein
MKLVQISFRKSLIGLIASLLGVEVTFNEPKEERPTPKDRDYRLSRKVWYDGTVHWVIEQFISSQLTLKALFPNYLTDKMIHIHGKPVPNDWIPLPQGFGSEEEAIQYLNETLRSCEVMEVSHYYID